MFFLLSKLLDFLLLPTVWLLALLVAALLTKRPARRRGLLVATLLLLLIGTNNALVNEALLAWEVPPVRLHQLPARADVGVLLTGIGDGRKSPHDRVYLSRGADRLTHTLWLYRAGRIRRILISGGSGALEGVRTRTEARELYILLRLAGVPAQDIWLEEQSRNTHENAVNTKALLARHPEARSMVLITSAFHMRRAQGCFARVGLHPAVFPADFRTTDRRLTPDYWLIPDPDALNRWSLLLHELTGYVVYKVQGYV